MKICSLFTLLNISFFKNFRRQYLIKLSEIISRLEKPNMSCKKRNFIRKKHALSARKSVTYIRISVAQSAKVQFRRNHVCCENSIRTISLNFAIFHRTPNNNYQILLHKILTIRRILTLLLLPSNSSHEAKKDCYICFDKMLIAKLVNHYNYN